MTKHNQPTREDKRQDKPVGNYNPGGQAGESVESGGQRPADSPKGPFLGRAARSNAGGNRNSDAADKPPKKA